MVGLSGIVATQKNDEDIKVLLSRMCRSIKYKDEHKTDIYTNKGIGMGRVHLGIFSPKQQPIFSEDKMICIMMEGEIYDYQKLKEELISKGYKFTVGNDPELILHMYEEYEYDLIYKLNGIFSIVIWDERSQKLLMMNDRYGLRPIYYTHNNGYLLFGSEVKAILQDEDFERIVDDMSVTEFFYFGYILGNKTFFQGIELLPPASIMVYDKGQISIRQYWDLHFHENYENLSEKYYIEKLSDLVFQSVEKHMKGDHKIGILLSGGLDSRTIIGSVYEKYMKNEKYMVHTFTYGKPNCSDIKFAQMISDRLGTTHHCFDLKPEDVALYAKKLVYSTDGMLNIFYANFLLTGILENISEHVDIVLHGWIGDSTMGDYLGYGHFIDLIIQDNLKMFRRLYEPLPVDLQDLFSENYFPIAKKSLDYSKDYILNMGNNIKSPSNRLIYYNIKERQRRTVSVGFIHMRNYLESRTPFSDYDYVDFGLNIPPMYKINKSLYKKMILKTFPRLSDIPHSTTGSPLYKSYLTLKMLELYKQIINKITGRVFRHKLFSDEEKKLVDYGEWIRTNEKLRSYVLSILLDEKTLGRGYFDKEFIIEIVGCHMCGKKDYSILIGRLLTFELWNRQFIDESDNNKNVYIKSGE